MCHQQNTRTASPSGYCVEGLSIPSMTLCPRGRRSMSYAVRPRSGAWLASAGTRRRQGNTPPAEVHLRYICALTSRYVGQVGPSRAARGAVATGDGGCGQPSACVINLSGRKPVGVATTPRIRPVREVLRPHTDRMRAVRIRTVRSPGTSRPRGRRRPLSRRGHRWRIVGLWARHSPQRDGRCSGPR